MDASGLHEEAGAVWGLREPAAVDVQLAGRIQIHGPQGTLDGATLGGRRAQIAFARLALGAGHTVSRDLLADAIWDEYLPASWVPALRNVIASVRRWLNSSELGGSIALSSVGDGYRLEMPVDSTVDLLVLASDTERAEEAARGGDHAAALRFAQDALARASSPMFEGAQGDWVEGLRAHVSELRMRLQRVSGQTALALGDVARAERVARQLIATAPLREDAHRLLMSALYAAGNRGEALSAYDTCRRLLADELGAMPSQPTEALFLEILAEDRDQRATSGAGPSRRAVGGPLLVLQRQTPFVGRGKLLEDLRARLGLAVEAGPLLVSVSGAPGMGKTRLAAELAALAHAAGMSVLYGRADDRIAVPYGSLLEALEGGFVAHDPHEAAARLGDHGRVMGSLLPSLAAARGSSERTGIEDLDRLRVEKAIVAALRLLADPNGTLLLLDDMQWASRAEIGVVHAIARESSRLALLVLMLAREAEDPASPSPRGPNPRVQRLALEPLTVEEVTELAAVNRRRTSEDDLETEAAGVWRMSGGNPLLASELLRSRRPGGQHERPARISELVREQLAGLPTGTDDVLRTAAVAGLEFDPRVVAAASAVEESEALGIFRAAQRAGLLLAATRNSEWWAFRHSLVRDSLLESLTQRARLRVHQALGAVLEAERILTAGSRRRATRLLAG